MKNEGLKTFLVHLQGIEVLKAAAICVEVDGFVAEARKDKSDQILKLISNYFDENRINLGSEGRDVISDIQQLIFELKEQ